MATNKSEFSVDGISIKKRGGSYRIIVSKGRDENGKKIVETCTFKPDPNKTEKQNLKALDEYAHDFARQVNANLPRITKKGSSYIVKVFRSNPGVNESAFETAEFVPDPRKTDAENQKNLADFAAAFEKKVNPGLFYGDVQTFRDYAEIWMKTYQPTLARTTFARYRTLLDNMLYPELAEMKLSAINATIVQKTMNSIRERGYTIGKTHKPYSDESIRTARILLSSILSSAEADDIIKKNPCILARKKNAKKAKREQVQCFTPKQAAFFLDAISRPIPVRVPEHAAKRNGKIITIKEYFGRPIEVSLEYQCFFTLAIHSGCRRGELCGLTWECVDFDDRSITIKQSAAYVSGESFVKDPKTKSGNRTIYLPQTTMNLLKRWKTQQARNMMLLGTAWEGERGDNLRVFTSDNGNPIHIHTPNKEFKRFLNAINANIPEEENKLPMIHLHDLRHTSASILISEGLDLVTVSKRLGHSDPSVTMSIYAHAFEERDREAADALDKALNAIANYYNENRESM